MIGSLDIDQGMTSNFQSTGWGIRPPTEIHRQLTQEDLEMLCYSGSGGMGESPFYSPASGSYIVFSEPPEGKLVSPAIAQVIKEIREAFGVSMEELAQMCSTTRKTIYNWKDGTSEPRKKVAKKLFTLHRAARDWTQSGSSQPKAQMYKPVLGDKSLFDLLTEEPLDLEAIEFVRSRLEVASLGYRLIDTSSDS